MTTIPTLVFQIHSLFKRTDKIDLSTAQKMKFSINDFFNKCDQIRRLRIWWHLLKKSLMENLLFCAVETGALTLQQLTSLKKFKFCSYS